MTNPTDLIKRLLGQPEPVDPNTPSGAYIMRNPFNDEPALPAVQLKGISEHFQHYGRTEGEVNGRSNNGVQG